MSNNKMRLVTRSDFDGLVCAVLFKHMGMIDEIKFVHPKDMQDEKIEISSTDITTNLPYVSSAFLVFDHHSSESIRNQERPSNYILDPNEPSAARLVWKYYGGHDVFPSRWDAMMTAVDKADSAQFGQDEVVHPTGWDLLNFLMDARTGLGRFRDFRISNYDLMMDLIDYCKNHEIDEILTLPDVQERVELYFEHEPNFREQLRRCSRVYNNLVVLDLQDEETIFAGNRFVIYALFPEVNISIHRLWGLRKQNTVFAVGKSIFDRTSKTNIGELMLEFGGGGHQAAGTCQIDNDKADDTLQKLIKTINDDG